MRAKEVLELHLKATKKTQVDSTAHCKLWLESEFGKKMLRPLFISRGKGGGQRYKILWEVMDIKGNANLPCVYFTEMAVSHKYLKAAGDHMTLQEWIDS